MAAAVLERVVLREPDALETFFDHYYDRVYAHVVNMLRDPILGQDLTQEVFLRLHRAVTRLDPRRDPTGWVFTVATNVIRDHWRSREHKKAERELGFEDQAELWVTHPDPDVQSVMERDEELRTVWSALHGLGESDREIILLRDYEELSTDEICRMLDIKPDAVRQRHSRAVVRLGALFREIDKNDELSS